MRRVLGILLSLLLVFTVVGCSQPTKTNDDSFKETGKIESIDSPFLGVSVWQLITQAQEVLH